MSCGTLRKGSRRHRRRSPSHGCSPGSNGSCQSRARPNWRAWKKTSAPRQSGPPPMRSVRSRAPPHGSRFKAHATPNTWRKGPISEMRIGILGSGLMGAKLGTIWARAGHEVVFSYARSEQKLKKLAREAQGNARAGTPGEAAREADALLLAVHWSRVDDVLKQAGDVSGKVVVSCSLPMNADNTDPVIATSSLGADG